MEVWNVKRFLFVKGEEVQVHPLECH